MHAAVSVRFQMTVYSAGVHHHHHHMVFLKWPKQQRHHVISPYFSLSPSPMPPDAVTWVMHGRKRMTCLCSSSAGWCGVVWCGLYNFFVLKMQFYAGYRRVRVICACGVYVRKYSKFFQITITVTQCQKCAVVLYLMLGKLQFEGTLLQL